MIAARRLSIGFVLVIAAALLYGCVGIFPLTKKTSDTPPSPPETESVQKAEIPEDTTKERPADELPPPPKRRSESRGAKDDLLPVPGDKAKYDPPPPPPADKSVVTVLALRDKDEINRSALKFSKNFKNVEHVRTCYSKLFGGWYVLMYIKNKKNYDLNQYSWNSKTKEWELMYINKSISVKKLEYLLKSEVVDEKCFLLK
jgi:hypothetical protein